MIGRRDFLIGGACLVAASSALALVPRRRVLLADGLDLGKALPARFGGWSQVETAGVVAPRDENDLASKLYSQIVTRVYRRDSDGQSVMLLIAYGDTQNDLLQLHRPEVCYAAFGFRISDSQVHPITVAPGVALPARRLVASATGRTEYISYWTRIGEYLPVDGADQRWSKLRTQFAGEVPDGVLTRVSSNLEDPAASFALNDAFATAMLHGLRPAARPALVGRDRAALLSRTA